MERYSLNLARLRTGFSSTREAGQDKPRRDNNKVILAMGPESDGNFSIYRNYEIIYFSGYGDLLDDDNFNKYEDELLDNLKRDDIVPDIVAIDLHPLFKTSQLGRELAIKYKSELVEIQHHQAHIFASVIDKMMNEPDFKPQNIIGIASDGTGHGDDETVWGGEVLKYEVGSMKYERVGSLENQILIGGDLAIKEPARMLLSILLKLNKSSKSVNSLVGNYYSEKELDVLIKQYEQKFNCQVTTSTGRVLDAISVLLGFSNNKREYKHQPIELLEENSTEPYDIEPKVEFDKNKKRYVLATSYLLGYLIDNLYKDKKRLAATAQIYLAKGLYKVVKQQKSNLIFFSGGMANNELMAEYLTDKGVYINKKIPSGDKGISVGQIASFLIR